MNWLARLKKLDSATTPTLQNLQKADTGAFVGFVGTLPAPFQNSGGDSRVSTGSDANPANDALHEQYEQYARARETQPLDSVALDAADILAARLALFTERGLSLDEAEAVAARLVIRDRQMDDRSLCLECVHLSGTVEARRCGQWSMLGLTSPAIPADLALILQRCGGFKRRQ